MPKFKYCFVPFCQNTSKSSPDKLFIKAPKCEETIRKWYDAVNLPFHDGVEPYCCADHFNMDKDCISLADGVEGKSKMKRGVVPHIFLHPNRVADSSRHKRSEEDNPNVPLKTSSRLSSKSRAGLNTSLKRNEQPANFSEDEPETKVKFSSETLKSYPPKKRILKNELPVIPKTEIVDSECIDAMKSAPEVVGRTSSSMKLNDVTDTDMSNFSFAGSINVNALTLSSPHGQSSAPCLLTPPPLTKSPMVMKRADFDSNLENSIKAVLIDTDPLRSRIKDVTSQKIKIESRPGDSIDSFANQSTTALDKTTPSLNKLDDQNEVECIGKTLKPVESSQSLFLIPRPTAVLNQTAVIDAIPPLNLKEENTTQICLNTPGQSFGLLKFSSLSLPLVTTVSNKLPSVNETVYPPALGKRLGQPENSQLTILECKSLNADTLKIPCSSEITHSEETSNGNNLQVSPDLSDDVQVLEEDKTDCITGDNDKVHISLKNTKSHEAVFLSEGSNLSMSNVKPETCKEELSMQKLVGLLNALLPQQWFVSVGTWGLELVKVASKLTYDSRILIRLTLTAEGDLKIKVLGKPLPDDHEVLVREDRILPSGFFSLCFFFDVVANLVELKVCKGCKVRVKNLPYQLPGGFEDKFNPDQPVIRSTSCSLLSEEERCTNCIQFNALLISTLGFEEMELDSDVEQQNYDDNTDTMTDEEMS